MRVGLHDSDKTNFPNYALMKISAYHKAQGDTVEWWIPLERFDRVYSSKVFTFTPVNPYLPEGTIKGGTGYGLYEDLPQEIDAMFPDYSIYPGVDYAIGYITRGCVRKCPWCVVPKKEGWIRPYRTWRDLVRPDSNKLVLMDNNILACDHGRAQLADMIGKPVKIDCNQGLDARLIDEDMARVLGKIKWISSLRMSADTDAMLDIVLQKIDLLKRVGGGKTAKGICLLSGAGYRKRRTAGYSPAGYRRDTFCATISGLHDECRTAHRTETFCELG